MSGEVVMVYPTIISLLAIFNVRYEMDLSQVISINTVLSNRNPNQMSSDYESRTIVFGDGNYC
ncbi:MAG: hypothetical protein WAM14_25230 [Candidatus Nitrosopolaris sp.]